MLVTQYFIVRPKSNTLALINSLNWTLPCYYNQEEGSESRNACKACPKVDGVQTTSGKRSPGLRSCTIGASTDACNTVVAERRIDDDCTKCPQGYRGDGAGEFCVGVDNFFPVYFRRRVYSKITPYPIHMRGPPHLFLTHLCTFSPTILYLDEFFRPYS